MKCRPYQVVGCYRVPSTDSVSAKLMEYRAWGVFEQKCIRYRAFYEVCINGIVENDCFSCITARYERRHSDKADVKRGTDPQSCCWI